MSNKHIMNSLICIHFLQQLIHITDRHGLQHFQVGRSNSNVIHNILFWNGLVGGQETGLK